MFIVQYKIPTTPLRTRGINTTLKHFPMRHITLIYLKGLKSYWLTLKRPRGGRNQDAAFLDALPVLQGKGTIIKPPCNFHFWCLKLVQGMNLGGCIKKILKILNFEKKILSKQRRKFQKFYFFPKNGHKFHFFVS